MPAFGGNPYPLPRDPSLAEVAAAMRDTGHWGFVVDNEWRLVYATDEVRRTGGGLTELAPLALGMPFFGSESLQAMVSWRLGPNTMEIHRGVLAHLGCWVLTDTAGGRPALREAVDPALRDVVAELVPADPVAMSFDASGTVTGGAAAGSPVFAFRIRDEHGRLRGTAWILKPAAGMSTIGTMTSMGDLRHFERMQRVSQAGRRPAAILFADLEGSTPLAKRLSTTSYFSLGRRLVRAGDQCVIDAGGLVGRHVGDGVVAFFLAETSGSESAAARACIVAARAFGRAARDVAARSDLPPEDVVVRFGLHWGSTLYVGNIATIGRTEVTALGDEMNETSRIEACAVGGRVLASKALLERLSATDAAALDLDLDLDSLTYTMLADLGTATDKARRDAPAIAVCDVRQMRAT